EASHNRPAAVENLERDRSPGGARQVVVDYRAVGRILTDRLIDRERCVGVLVPAYPDGTGGPVEEGVGRGGGRGGLAQRRDVVQDPAAATVSADDEIAVVHDQVTHRRGRQVEAQRLPVAAVVERDVRATLGPRIQQPTPRGVLSDGV